MPNLCAWEERLMKYLGYRKGKTCGEEISEMAVKRFPRWLRRDFRNVVTICIFIYNISVFYGCNKIQNVKGHT